MQGNFAGKHILIDLVSNNTKKLSDVNFIYHYLTDLTEKLEMTLLGAPQIFEFPFTNESIVLARKLKNSGIESPILDDFNKEVERKKKFEGGVSGICVWAESHSSLHTWTENNYVSFDVYSCKDFDEDFTINYIKEQFEAKSGNILVVKRYVDIPHEVKIIQI